jgi:hypothetical protein
MAIKIRPSGRRKTSRETRDLIRKMSIANPLWGAPRIHGETLPSHQELSLRVFVKNPCGARGGPLQHHDQILQHSVKRSCPRPPALNALAAHECAHSAVRPVFAL